MFMDLVDYADKEKDILYGWAKRAFSRLTTFMLLGMI